MIFFRTIPTKSPWSPRCSASSSTGWKTCWLGSSAGILRWWGWPWRSARIWKSWTKECARYISNWRLHQRNCNMHCPQTNVRGNIIPSICLYQILNGKAERFDVVFVIVSSSCMKTLGTTLVTIKWHHAGTKQVHFPRFHNVFCSEASNNCETCSICMHFEMTYIR